MVLWMLLFSCLFAGLPVRQANYDGFILFFHIQMHMTILMTGQFRAFYFLIVTFNFHLCKSIVCDYDKKTRCVVVRRLLQSFFSGQGIITLCYNKINIKTAHIRNNIGENCKIWQLANYGLGRKQVIKCRIVSVFTISMISFLFLLFWVFFSVFFLLAFRHF